MKEKTYLRMTKKRPLRGFKLFRQKYLTKQKVFEFLAKIKLVQEVKKDFYCPITHESLDKVRLLNEKIETDRGKFNLSYVAEGEERINCWFFRSKFRKKEILYVVSDEREIHLSVMVRSECESFVVKVDPFTSTVVHRGNPVFVAMNPCPKPLISSDEGGYENLTNHYRRIQCDFLNARLGVSVKNIVLDEKDIDMGIKEIVQRARWQIESFIKNNPEEINERLTGVKYDGEFCTKEGKKLIPNCICHRCGRPVFESSTEGYTAQCLCCDEDLYDIEVRKIDPEMYKDIYEISKTALYKILTE